MSIDSPRPDPSEALSAADDATRDLALRGQLRAMPPPAPATDLEALHRRVLAQWREQSAPPPRKVHGAVLAAGGAGRYWLTGSAGLLLGVALVAGLWLQRSDPVMDDLVHPDVLSQMAAGEM